MVFVQFWVCEDLLLGAPFYFAMIEHKPVLEREVSMLHAHVLQMTISYLFDMLTKYQSLKIKINGNNKIK